MSNKTDYIGTAEAAKLLRVSGRRVAGLCLEGKFPGAYREGRSWKIPVEALKQYLEAMGKMVSSEIGTLSSRFA